MEHGLKPGIYKISNPADGSVLTVNAKGLPHPVLTAPWEDLNTQKWKVKVRTEGSFRTQIIRNETLGNNEVSKILVEGEMKSWTPVNWKFEPVASAEPNTFTLHNGKGFLTAKASGERIAVIESGNQGWHFEYLSEIIREAKTTDGE